MSSVPLPAHPPMFQQARACNLTKGDIDQLASALGERLDYSPGTPIEPIVEKLGGEIRFRELDEWLDDDSIEVYGPGQFRIFLLNVAGVLRNRFTIAHELGHYFLHSRIGEVPIKVNRSGSDRVEWEANWFAAGFLMPEQPFREAVKRDSSPAYLSAVFMVSVEAAMVRKKVLGLA
ncbi:MAG: ImmA/IrrE family metallo-endopeptidase [Verrucomicrobiae bacterium]|nr:ImmA/IrrE family metallo-endopeptidase [Verrucomicrobiae bacterium]MCB1233910.1 ImmA/IrrE family metallo-endopeptidase [Verrucomicrobiae bacterium]